MSDISVHTDRTRAALIDWFRRRGPHLAAETIVNVALPTLIYGQLHQRFGDVDALLASFAPSLAWTAVVFLRERRVDAYGVLAMAVLALSTLSLIGSGSPRLLLLREHMVTLLIALAFLFSAAIGRPLIGPLARASFARRSAADAAAFDARRGHAAVRHTVMVMTLVWGFGLLAGFALSAVMAFTLSIGRNLALGPFVFYGMMGGLGLWTVLYRRHRERLVRVACCAANGSI